ncbi:MAG: TIGR03960 family B12-binding radical SAM protein, partial [Acetanaerobacterium sp.]
MMSLKDKLDGVLTSVERPARYIGGELGSIVKNAEDVKLRFAFCFPDTYEIGMSHLGMKILYSLLNRRDDIWCERVFAPWLDMRDQMLKNDIPLYGLESLEPIAGFDMIGFSLQYELSYTNVLYMLQLAGVPLRAADRTTLSPLVVAGGPCTCNPEPMSEFIDLFMLGEGEEHIIALCDLYLAAKEEGLSKAEFLRRAADIEGVYVPSLYDVSYNGDGTITEIKPRDGVPETVRKAIIKDLDAVYYPEQFVVPFTSIIHDRAQLEVMRGCLRGCRFCQAGFIYRPMREKHSETLNANARDLCASTGYEEISLSSLSTSDYSQLGDLLEQMIGWTSDAKINMSLPSLRIDNFPQELMEKIKKVRKSGLTFAPEAGTQRLRDVINKNITEEDILGTCRQSFEGGYTSVKLYFMLGLPTETEQDVEGIIELAQKIVDLYYSLPTRQKGRGVNVGVSVATFVPKP